MIYLRRNRGIKSFPAPSRSHNSSAPFSNFSVMTNVRLVVCKCQTHVPPLAFLVHKSSFRPFNNSPSLPIGQLCYEVHTPRQHGVLRIPRLVLTDASKICVFLLLQVIYVCSCVLKCFRWAVCVIYRVIRRWNCIIWRHLETGIEKIIEKHGGH